MAAHAGVGPLVVTRIALGMSEGLAFPAAHAVIASEVPRERAAGGGGGGGRRRRGFRVRGDAGIDTRVRMGGAFYAFGALGVLWIPFWLALSEEVGRRARTPRRERRRKRRRRKRVGDGAIDRSSRVDVRLASFIRRVASAHAQARGSRDMRRPVYSVVGHVRFTLLVADVLHRGARRRPRRSSGVHLRSVPLTGRRRTLCRRLRG